jgi:hypothetical protein
MLLISLSGVSAAADRTAPPPYALLLQSEIAGDDAGAWAEAVSTAARAHAEHELGNSWTAYRRLTGGPDHAVWFFFGLDELAELDRWRPNREILIDALGPAEGREVLETLELGATSSDRIIAYHAPSSRPRETAPSDPPRYLWVVAVSVDDGKLIEYAALHKRLRQAHAGHPDSPHWMVYGSAIGGDRSEHLMLYPFDAFAEVDSWPSRSEVLSKALGQREAARLAAALDAITETTTSLWRLEPSLSQLE